LFQTNSFIKGLSIVVLFSFITFIENINNTAIKTITINKATASDFEIIKKKIKEFDLDNRDLQVNQFLVAKQNNVLLGFGRIRKHVGCDEFCSLGVLKEKRFNGIAKLLIEARIKIATQPIYLVCITPKYFESLGFVVADKFPEEMTNKLNYCTAELAVPEKYVVMKYEGIKSNGND